MECDLDIVAYTLNYCSLNCIYNFCACIDFV